MILRASSNNLLDMRPLLVEKRSRFQGFLRRRAGVGLVRGTLLLSCAGVILVAVSLSATPLASDDVPPAGSESRSFFPVEPEEPLVPKSLSLPESDDPRLIEVQR